MKATRQKTGILLAAFGTSTPKGQAALKLFSDEVRNLYPNTPIRWAFTSSHMRTRLSGFGKKTDSIYKAISRMAYEKFSHIAVQTLHMIPGVEFESMLQEIAYAQNEHKIHVTTGLPMLSTPDDIDRAAVAIIHHLASHRAPSQAVICMGHGTWHKGAAGYASLAVALQKRDPMIFTGTLEGDRDINALLPEVKATGVKKALLLPLLSVVGKHAEQDMAGASAHSWKSCLEAEGISAAPILTGTVEYCRLRAIWLDHLKEAMRALLHVRKIQQKRLTVAQLPLTSPIFLSYS